jgi:periplasmic divalent cation tolerance protein
MAIHLVYITTRDSNEAKSIGHHLVASRLAACVNIIEGMISIYRWNGELQEDQEAVLIAKTTENRVTALIEAVKERHSYECPCIVSFPVTRGNEAYLNWIAGQVS